MNNALWLACVGLVLAFRSSSNLAATYGVAVTGTMTTTTVLSLVVARKHWRWSLWKVCAARRSVPGGGPGFLRRQPDQDPGRRLVPARGRRLVFLLMTTWKKGRARLSAIVLENTLPIDLFLPDIGKRKPSGCRASRCSSPRCAGGAPPVLLHHLKHNKVLHEKVILMSVMGQEIPQVADERAGRYRELGEGFYEVVAHYGFMETPDVPSVLQSLTLQYGDGRQLTGGGRRRRHSTWGGRRSFRSTGGEGRPG